MASGGTLVVDPVTSIAALDASEDVVAVAASASSSDSTDSYSPTSNDDTLIGASDISASSTWASDLLSAEFGFGADLIRFGSKSTGYFARLDAGHDSWLSQAEWQALLETPAAFNSHAASPWLPASALAMQASNLAAPAANLMNDYFQFVDTSAGNGHSDRPPTLQLSCRTRPLRTARSMPRRARQTVTPMARPRYGLTTRFDHEASPVSKSLPIRRCECGQWTFRSDFTSLTRAKRRRTGRRKRPATHAK